MTKHGGPGVKHCESSPWKNRCRFCVGIAKGMSLIAGTMPIRRHDMGDRARQRTCDGSMTMRCSFRVASDVMIRKATCCRKN